VSASGSSRKHSIGSHARGPAEKIQARGLPLAIARRLSGGTTVSATLHVAGRCGIRVFATGGIGGVHRRAELTGDVSENLFALSRERIAVVSSGAKAILPRRRDFHRQNNREAWRCHRTSVSGCTMVRH
jgi:pseudouridine-5'-phosphate glycosidase